MRPHMPGPIVVYTCITLVIGVGLLCSVAACQTLLAAFRDAFAFLHG